VIADARERFAELAQLPDAEIDLALGALLIAAEAEPELDFDACLGALDELAEAARPLLRQARDGRERALYLTQFLHAERGFIGNRDQYDDPTNSFLNRVLERRTGIPITLSLVYIEVARRLDLPIAGVGFPGHFLVKYSDAAEEVVIDPFFGVLLDEEDCRARLRNTVGPDVPFDERALRAATPREILVRMLTNLKQFYFREEDFERALACSDRILLLFPELPTELRDRGIIYQRLECFGPALADLERFVELAPGDPVAERIRSGLDSLRERARRIH
jgi:regulator of sirC expression with transglutaminase-like and TPR domain